MGSRLAWFVSAVAIASVFLSAGCSEGADPSTLTKQETPAPPSVKALPDSTLPMGGVVGKDPIGTGPGAVPKKK